MKTQSVNHRILHLGLILVTVCFLTNGWTRLGAARFHQPEDIPILLQIDTFIDTHSPAYQVCSPLPEDCSLRGAISLANLSPAQSYSLQLPAGNYPLTLAGAGEDNNATGDLDLYGNITLVGNGADNTQINANLLDRALHIHDQATVMIQGLTITGGQLPNGLTSLEMSGGGIFNRGNLTLEAAVVTNNAAGAGISSGAGGDGGGIYTSGSLILRNSSRITNNQSGKGGDADHPYTQGGSGGNGGGIGNAGTLFIENSSLSGNVSGPGGRGSNGYSGVKGGRGGSGGGVYSLGSLTILQSSLSGNTGGDGGPGGDGDTSGCIEPAASFATPLPFTYEPDQSTGGNGGDGGAGGAVFSQGALRVIHTTMADNHTGNGGSGGAGFYFGGVGGHGGDGGGISHRGTLQALNAQVMGNQAGNGGGGGGSCYKAGPTGGGGGNGGGMAGSGAFLIQDSLVNGNLAGNSGGIVGGGDGGGVYFDDGEVNFSNTLINNNQAGNGGNGGGVCLLDSTASFVNAQVNSNTIGVGGGGGGGVYNNNSSTSFVNSQVNLNTAGDGYAGTYDCGWGGCFCSNGGPGGDGGGIFNQGALILVNTFVENNNTGNGGPGGVGDDCYGASGEDGDGGGIHNQGFARIFHSQVRWNHTSSGSGGGLFNAGSLTVEFTSVIGNTTRYGYVAHGCGGGVYNSGSLSMNGVALVRNLVGEQGYAGFGGGLYTSGSRSTLTNLWIAENQVGPGGKGSGIYVDHTSLDLLHTTLARNTGGEGSGILAVSSQVALTNTILVSQTVGITASVGSAVMLQDTLLGSGRWANSLDFAGLGQITSTHELTGDPAFLSPELGNYHIGLGSAALDHGGVTPLTTDIDNQPRPNPDTGLPDLGADEFWDFIPISEVTVSGPISGTAYTPLTFMAAVVPITATPNILLIWTPLPIAGQTSSSATFTWPEAGVYTVTLTAMNAGSLVQAYQVVTIQPAEFKIYTPLLLKDETLP